MIIETDIELDKFYKDKVTGFTGIAIGFAIYNEGTRQVLLGMRSGFSDKSIIANQWFNENQIEEVNNES